NRGGRIARAQQPAEGWVEFDQHEPRRIDPLAEQRLGHRPGAGTKLDDRARPACIDIGRHGARERPPRRRHRAGGQRLLNPRSDEAHFVVEANSILLFEATNACFDFLLLRVELLLEFLLVSLELLLDFSFECTLPLLEQLNLPLDPPFQGAFEKALLFFKLLLKELQGRERHVALTLQNNCRFAIKPVKVKRVSVKRQLPQAAPERLKNSLTLPKNPAVSGCVS